jgi:RNA recognition motif-containing protein
MYVLGAAAAADERDPAGAGRSRGCGIVEFASDEQAQGAMASMSDTVLDGRPIFVREDRH